MQNVKLTDLPCVSDHPSPVTAVINRVVAIAPAPLLPGEQEAEYVTHVTRIVAVAKPRDAIEEILTRDAIDLTWEILRLRRMKVGLLRASMGSGIRRVMGSLGYIVVSAGEVATSWAAGEKTAKNEVAAALKKAQLTMEDVTAKTLEDKIDPFERFDRMLASSEARRNNALREIERHRAALGAAVRQAVDEIQDAEFHDVDTGELAGAAPP
jgi:protein-tyrosine-phosphatase